MISSPRLERTNSQTVKRFYKAIWTIAWDCQMEVLHFYIEDGIGTYFWQDIDNWGNVVWGSIWANLPDSMILENIMKVAHR